jgi:hypothetical protein
MSSSMELLPGGIKVPMVFVFVADLSIINRK